MSKFRFAMVLGVAGLSLATTLVLESQTNFIAGIHERVGVKSYSIADAKDAVANITGHGEELQVLMAYTGDQVGMGAHLPRAPQGWNRVSGIEPSREFLMEFGREIAMGPRPTDLQIWPAGAMVLTESGRVVLDAQKHDAIYGGTRAVSAAIYEHDLTKLLVSIEKLPLETAAMARKSDVGVSNHLKRETFEISGHEFLVLTDPTSPQVLLRAFVGEEYVVDVRGRGYVAEIVELIEDMNLDGLVPNPA